MHDTTNQHGPIVDRLAALIANRGPAARSAFAEDRPFVEIGLSDRALDQFAADASRGFGVSIASQDLRDAVPTPSALAARIAERLESAAIPLTDVQRELWMASQVGPDAARAVVDIDVVDVVGPLNRDAFLAALSGGIAAHDVFSMRIDAERLAQRVAPEAVVDVDFVDLTVVADHERADALSALTKVEAPNLVDGPAFSVRLARMAPERHALVIARPQLLLDRAGVDHFVEDVAARYATALGSEVAELESSGSFSAFARTAARVGDADADAALAHWKGVFADGAPANLELPTDRRRGLERRFSGGGVRRMASDATKDAIRRAADAAGVDAEAFLMASYMALLARLSGQDDLVVGATLDGARAHGFDGVGRAAVTLPIRGRDLSTAAFETVAQNVHAALVAGAAHPSVAIGDVARAVEAPRHPGRLPLAEAVFSFEGARGAITAGDVRMVRRRADRGFALHDLSLSVAETPGGLTLDWEYASALFNRETVELWADYHLELIAAMVDDPRRAARDAALLSPQALDAKLAAWNATERDFNRQAYVYDAFEAQASATPESVALICGRDQISYGALSARSGRIAGLLAERGVEPGALVGLHIERSIDMVACILAIWKAGAAYLPMDPYFPAERLRYMIEDSGARMVLSHSRLADVRPDLSVDVIELDQEAKAVDAADPIVRRDLDPGVARANVFYTSGSTGKPKGVEVAHRTIVNFLNSFSREPGFGPDDRMLAVSTLSFDISTAELFTPLSTGGSVVIATRDDVLDGYALAELMEDHGVTIMQATPATWRLLIDCEWEGDQDLRIVTGGEALSPTLAKELLERVGVVWNFYGPTEATIWSTGVRIVDADDVTIGRPIDNTWIYILDEHAQPTTPGAAGELWIGGDGVALGYLGRPELTADRFRADPFRAQADARMYKTGDWARFRADGRVEFYRRLDDQVKVRGFRIELGEIESALSEHEAVAQAVVLIRQDVADDPRIVAYTVARPGMTASISDLRHHLRRFLPDYMIPQFFVELDSFPKTGSNKIDRNALPAPTEMRAPEIERIPPRTEVEKAIAIAWRDLLKVNEVFVSDNFFELGGTSLLAAQFVAQMRREHGLELALWPIVVETLEQLATSAASASTAAE